MYFTFVLTQQTGYILRLINYFVLEDPRHSQLYQLTSHRFHMLSESFLLLEMRIFKKHLQIK